jgi:hypothetical protein
MRGLNESDHHIISCIRPLYNDVYGTNSPKFGSVIEISIIIG